MTRIALATIAFCAALLAGCAEPLPRDRLDYAGEWRGGPTWLLITPDGRCEYERRSGGKSVRIDAPIQRFEGDNFVVGLGPFGTTFVVSKRPKLDNGSWKMTVDGVELTRVAAFGETRT